MKRLIRQKRIAILTELITSLRAKNLWTGELQIQQAVHLLQEALGVPMGHEFVWDFPENAAPDDRAGHLVNRLPRLSPSHVQLLLRQADELLASTRCLTEGKPHVEAQVC